MYDYPLDSTWTIQETIDVMSLYTAVEQAYEEGISAEAFLKAYHLFTAIVDDKSSQRALEKRFLKTSGYSIHDVLIKAKESDWIEMK